MIVDKTDRRKNHPLEKLRKEDLVVERTHQEKEEKQKIAEINRLDEDKKKLEKDNGNISNIKKLDQKILKLNGHLEKIRSHIRIIDNLIFIQDNKKLLENEKVMSKLTNLTKSRLDEFLGKFDLKDKKAREMLMAMEPENGLGEKIGILLKMIRPQGMISPLSACFSGIYLTNMAFPSYAAIIMPFILIILTWSGGILLNDYYDYETDSAIETDRVIPSGKISKKDILNASTFLLTATFLLSLVVSIKLLIIISIDILLIILYNSTLKKKGLLGSISFGIIEGLSFAIGVFSIGTFNNLTLLVLTSIIFLHTSVNMIGAIKNTEGDRETGNWTVPAKYGINVTVILIILSSLISLIIAYIPGMLNLLNLRYMPNLIVIILWLTIVAIMVKNESRLGFMALGMYDMGASIYYMSFITGLNK